MRYIIHSLHGPTVYQSNDRDEAFTLLARLWGTNGGWYRLIEDGAEIARVNTNNP